MTDKPLVSVIINCYNSEKYLNEIIESLIAQTYENWEAIFWDNCSNDSTSDIIANYNEPRFRYVLAEQHTTLGQARNLAMTLIKGELFCFLDSDDISVSRDRFVTQELSLPCSLNDSSVDAG
jgi:glycosyltransferase involved in cell wall biosynthesis